jgi:uncharacterized Rossmann fold enzyme
LAYHFGARRIILLGYDMQHTGGKRHWHPDYPSGAVINGEVVRMDNATPVINWRGRFSALARDLERESVEVVNATRTSALRCFPQMKLEAALDLPALA